MKISRVWAMPSSETFSILPIRNFVFKYLNKSHISIDPFARNFTSPTYTNDLNPNTKAKYHLDSLNFLQILKQKSIKADLVIFDPPYSPRQIKECYEGIGLKMNGREALRTASWKAEKDVIDQLLKPNGIFLWFNWNSAGMGQKRNYKILEILLVCHGSGHNDTICMAEQKMPDLFNK
ncbi:unnamed protein product [marine sediment metagenome]|uniref:DNA methylase N-4/N-6 domain-containing protein n=1 Tax=marine sediment metagenome TaxID=412755 RepID=X1GAX1_9ZZZZ